MLLDAIVRRFPAMKTLAEATQSLRLTGALSLASAQVEGEGCEESRAGRRFMWGPQNGLSTNGVAPVGGTSNSLPTTAAQWSLWNADTNRSYAFDSLGTLMTSGTAGAFPYVLLACFYTTPSQAAVAMQTGMAVQNMANGGLSSKLIITKSVTITAPATPTWFPIAVSPATAVAGATGDIAVLNDNLKGRLILPPGQGLGLAVMGSAGTSALFAPFGVHVEKELDLE